MKFKIIVTDKRRKFIKEEEIPDEAIGLARQPRFAMEDKLKAMSYQIVDEIYRQ